MRSQDEVLLDRKLADQPLFQAVLGYAADFFEISAGERLRIDSPSSRTSPPVGLRTPTSDVEQLRLSVAADACQAQDLTAVDGQRDIMERLRAVVPQQPTDLRFR